MKSTALLLLCVTAVSVVPMRTQAQSFSPIRINSGGGSYTDSAGRWWSWDKNYSGGTKESSSKSISYTPDDPLYQTGRRGTFNYTFTVPAGTYVVTLKFAETWFTSKGQRVFNVAINGATVLSNFDIVAAAGWYNVAVDRAFTVTAGNGTGNLVIQFIHKYWQPADPKVNAVQIVSATTSTSAPVITTQPASRTVVAGQTATFTVAASGTTPLSYQWRKNGVNISGGTSSSYTTPPATTSDSGAQFSVRVSNSAGSVTSNSATLTVNSATRYLSASPTSLSFGSIGIGNSSVLASTLTNTGNSNVTISGVQVSGAGFNVSGVSTGQILSPGQAAALNVTFAPASTGSVTGSAVVTSDASNSPTTVSLSGTGVQLVSHSATLQWTASTSSVVGYNVYSSSVSGGPYTKKTVSPVSVTSYKDTTVQSGQTYFYVVTSVNASSVESVYSTQVSAVIP